MRTVLIGSLGVGREVFVPVGILIFPVGEPCLLGVGVHRFEVERTVVGDERLETLVVMTGQIVDREAAERGTHGPESVFVDKRQVGHGIIYGTEIVVHALPGPVTGNLFVPRGAVAGKSATVGGQVEVGRQDDPHLLLLAVGCLHPTLLHFGQSELVEDMLVLIRELHHFGGLGLLGRSDGEKVVGMADGVAGDEQLLALVAQQLHRAVVVPAVGELLHLSVEIGLIDHHAGMPDAQEVERAGVGSPAEVFHVGVETLGDIFLFARPEVVDTQSVAVALIAIVRHTLPSDVLPVG